MLTETEQLNEQMTQIIEKKVRAFGTWRKHRLTSIKCNIAYLCGKQNIHLQGGEVMPIPEDSQYWYPVTANKIFPAVRNDIAVATKGRPTVDIFPAGTDEDDKATAKACQKILPYLQRINGESLGRETVVLWYDIDGVGWRKTYWCPKHHIWGWDKEGEPVWEGEVVIENVPNIELIFDYRVKDLSKIQWIIQHKVITYAEVVKIAGEEWVAENLEDKSFRLGLAQDTFDHELMNLFTNLSDQMIANNPKVEAGDMSQDDKVTDYYEFWHIPTPSMPMGAYAVKIGEKLFKNDPYPMEVYPHKQLPFIPAAPMEMKGITIGGLPPISQARPLQREFNKTRMIIMDGSDAHSNAIFMASKDSELNYKRIDNGNLCIIEYQGMMKPSREPGLSLPASIFAHLETIRKDIDEIFSFHEPSKGIMPEGGPRSAIGLQVLQEADYTGLSPIVKGIEASDEKIIYQALTLAVANYKREMNGQSKLIQVLGKDNQWTMGALSEEELNGKINVVVRAGSSVPMSKAAEQQKVTWAWQSGLLGNPMDPQVRNKVLKTMDIAGFDQVLQDNAKQINYAQMEFQNAEKLVGQMPPMSPDISENEMKEVLNQYIYVPPINIFDDDYVHIQEHSNFLISRHVDYVASGNQALMILAQAMSMHIMLHEQRIQAQMMQQLLMANPKLASEQEQGAKQGDKK